MPICSSALPAGSSARAGAQGLDVDVILAQQEPTRAFARRTLGTRWHGIRKRLRRVADLDPEQRHELRISLKKLRYGVDFFATVFEAEDSKLFRKRLAGLQDVLGHMNDTAVARRLVGDVVATLEADAHREAALLGAGILLGWYAGREGDTQSALAGRVAKLLAARPFWEDQGQ